MVPNLLLAASLIQRWCSKNRSIRSSSIVLWIGSSIEFLMLISISSKSSRPYNNSKLEYPDTDDLDVLKAYNTKGSSKSQFSLSSTKFLSFFSISLFLFSTSPFEAGW